MFANVKKLAINSSCYRLVKIIKFNVTKHKESIKECVNSKSITSWTLTHTNLLCYWFTFNKNNSLIVPIKYVSVIIEQIWFIQPRG